MQFFLTAKTLVQMVTSFTAGRHKADLYLQTGTLTLVDFDIYICLLFK